MKMNDSIWSRPRPGRILGWQRGQWCQGRRRRADSFTVIVPPPLPYHCTLPLIFASGQFIAFRPIRTRQALLWSYMMSDMIGRFLVHNSFHSIGVFLCVINVWKETLFFSIG